jgi:hypothetical protein
MTLLNTFANLGYKLPSSIGYFLVDFTTTCVPQPRRADRKHLVLVMVVAMVAVVDSGLLRE